jgi:hypothetical protein
MKNSGFTKRFPFICPKSSLGQKWSFLWTKIPITLQISILWCCKHHFHIPCLIFNIYKKKERISLSFDQISPIQRFSAKIVGFTKNEQFLFFYHIF